MHIQQFRFARCRLWPSMCRILPLVQARGERAAGRRNCSVKMAYGSMPCRLSAITDRNTYTVPALQCTYVGSIFTDATAGQVSAYRTWGQSRKFGVWNAYNRVPIILQAGDPTASWTYGTATIRESNGSTANTLTVFTGLPEEWAALTFNQKLESAGANGVTISVGIGLNSTTAYTGTIGTIGSPTSVLSITSVEATYSLAPIIGINVINSLKMALHLQRRHSLGRSLT